MVGYVPTKRGLIFPLLVATLYGLVICYAQVRFKNAHMPILQCYKLTIDVIIKIINKIVINTN